MFSLTLHLFNLTRKIWRKISHVCHDCCTALLLFVALADCMPMSLRELRVRWRLDRGSRLYHGRHLCSAECPLFRNHDGLWSKCYEGSFLRQATLTQRHSSVQLHICPIALNLSASFVASLSLCCRGPAPGGQRPALSRQEVSNCCPAITSQWRSGEDQNKTFPVCCSYSHCCISITLVSNLFTRAIHQNSTFTPTS